MSSASLSSSPPKKAAKKKKKKTSKKAPRDLLGKRVAVDRQGVTVKGVVKFHGTTEFHQGMWVGVALDMEQGMNDGCVCSLAHSLTHSFVCRLWCPLECRRCCSVVLLVLCCAFGATTAGNGVRLFVH